MISAQSTLPLARLRFFGSFPLALMFLLSMNIDHGVVGFGITSKPSATSSNTILKSQLHSNRGNDREELFSPIRRNVIAGGMLTPYVLTLFPGPAPLLLKPAGAAGFFQPKERRQLELCIVNVLRLDYWAKTALHKLSNNDGDEQLKKRAYLEARLGFKVVVSGKVGGGASFGVLTLAGLQVRDCLMDMQWWYYKGGYKKQREAQRSMLATAMRTKRTDVDQLIVDIIESLASIVEFDGLETTLDPSPRPALTLEMYTDDKAKFVTRMLAERVIPMIEDLIDCFGADIKSKCEGYIRQYYSREIPPSPGPSSPASGGTETTLSGDENTPKQG